MPLIDPIEKDELEPVNKSIMKILKRGDEKIRRETKPTLEEIQQKYGRVEVFELYIGKNYRGIVTSRQGKFYYILTTEGIVQISSDKIRNRSQQ